MALDLGLGVMLAKLLISCVVDFFFFFNFLFWGVNFGGKKE